MTELKTLLAEHWDWSMRRSPEWATTLGDHRFDDRLADLSAAAVADDRLDRRRFLDRGRAIDAGGLADADRVTLALFIGELEADIGVEACDDHRWGVSAVANPVSGYNYLPKRHTLTTPADGRNLVSRYRAIPTAVGHVVTNLRGGMQDGLVASAESIRRALAMVDAQLAEPVAEWALMEPAKSPPTGWPEAERTRFAADVTAAVAAVVPAYRSYRALLADELLPHARQDEGLAAMTKLPGCYAARIRQQTGLDKTPQELHQLGLEQIARSDEDLRALGSKRLGTADLPALLARLRSDPALHFASAEEVMATARASLAAAEAAVPKVFGRLPKAPCVVVPVPDYEAPYTTIAYYREPHVDGSKPGEYFVNIYQPATRPRYEARVLAYHEAVPGHHTQVALAMELGELPEFRRYGGNTAYIEGWALYTERLADELGLYPDDLDRIGMLSYDAWRGSRLVVDTGIHQLGWTRQQAIDFMLAHTALAANNIANEVDRYIAWPGQALAYKVGQLEILRLREHARSALGDRFDLAAFHDQVLAHGAVTLPVLASQIERWVAAQKK